MAEPTYEELKAQLAQLKKDKEVGLTLKVSPKGGVSLYGLGRFPVTLYSSQWEKLLDYTDTIRAFLASNRSQLKMKD